MFLFKNDLQHVSLRYSFCIWCLLTYVYVYQSGDYYGTHVLNNVLICIGVASASAVATDSLIHGDKIVVLPLGTTDIKTTSTAVPLPSRPDTLSKR